MSRKMQSINKKIVSVTSNGRGESAFSVRSIELEGSSNWSLSAQQAALNFRLRSSLAPYQSDWHVAGDPTLLIILNGVIEIELRDGTAREFSAGDLFVAEDYLIDGMLFDYRHGHRARIIGQAELQAVHIKLEKR
ncbi:MAG: hypothetical protein ACI854_001614 [Arenicella sp.]|jgi:hypothetical protein